MAVQSGVVTTVRSTFSEAPTKMLFIESNPEISPFLSMNGAPHSFIINSLLALTFPHGPTGLHGCTATLARVEMAVQ